MTSATLPPVDIPGSLGLAVIKEFYTPLLLLGADLAVIAASTSFCQAFNLEAGRVDGRRLSELGGGEWDQRTLSSLLRATAAGHASIDTYEMDLTRPGQRTRRLVINARNVASGDSVGVRLVLAVTDVTDALSAKQLNDDLLKEKAVLMQELQHRVANSLQIIASVLLQSARRVQSDETRSHLHDAHQRVMSVAGLQRQLAVSRQDQVGLRAYFTSLCEGIGASMVRDPDKLLLEVEADDSMTSADISVSLGLIVTELVINALKHAFIGDRPGRIRVIYRSTASSWTLSVGDNGVGMPKDPAQARPGLGTSIVEALARQLHACVEVADAAPGTVFSVTNAGLAGLGAQAA